MGSSAAEDRQQLFVAFSEADLTARGLRFSRGDMVEFMLSSDPETGRQTASQVKSGLQSDGNPRSSFESSVASYQLIMIAQLCWLKGFHWQSVACCAWAVTGVYNDACWHALAPDCD